MKRPDRTVLPALVAAFVALVLAAMPQAALAREDAIAADPSVTAQDALPQQDEDTNADGEKDGAADPDSTQTSPARPVLRARKTASGTFDTDGGYPIFVSRNGTVTTGTGWHKIDGSWYYGRDVLGHLETGWRKVSGTWYWFDPANNGRMVTGWRKISGIWYFFEDSGAMKTGWVNDGDSWYYTEASGAMAKGWRKVSNVWYYFNTSSGRMLTGTFEVGGVTYVAADSGKVPLSGWAQVGDDWYFTKASGAVYTGWLKRGGAWFWFDADADGRMATGWASIKDVWYYFNPTGEMATGWIKDGSSWYYAEPSGAMLTGWQTIGSSRYYLDPNHGGRMATGLFEVEGTTYVASNSGFVPSDGWARVGTGWYLADAEGTPLTGWVERGGSWYWFDAAKDGLMQVGWRKLRGVWYYFTPSGAMATGWINVGEKSYYLEPSGAMAANKWVGSRYVGADGAMLVNTTTPDGKIVDENGIYNAKQLNGIDISAWQSDIDVANVEADFIIVKATGGASYTSSTFKSQADAVLGSGKLLGLYHYAGDGQRGTTALSEAKHFCDAVRPYAGRAILFLDWESGGNHAWTGDQREVEWCKTFLDYVKKELGGTPMIYMSKSVTRESGRDWSSVAATYPLWVAQYAYSADSWHPGYLSDPWTDNGGTGAWAEPLILQYASGGRIEGYDYNLDLDLFYGTRDDWESYLR